MKVFVSSYLFSQYTDESRFLRKNWLSYWEHEVGRSENTTLSFKQIHLQSFVGNQTYLLMTEEYLTFGHSGHTSAVRSLCVLDDESTFLSGGRDQKLSIWKVENQNDNAVKLVFDTSCPSDELVVALELKVDGRTVLIANPSLLYHFSKVFDW